MEYTIQLELAHLIGMPRRSVYDYFLLALRRERAPLPEPAGPLVWGAGGICARFWVLHEGERLIQARFLSSSCATLVALCEHLCEAAPGAALSWAEGLSASDLLSWHPEIPAGRRDRADLCIRAFGAALRSRGESS